MAKIESVLIANRGEIARRVIRTLKKLGIKSVIVFHAVDRRSLAVAEADESIEIFANVPVAAYLDIDQIIEACKVSGVDALHPGYGFLAENDRFVDALEKANIKFIGPASRIMKLMGNKVQARAFCIENKFPIAPSVTNDGELDEFLQAARDIGAPLLIKAAAGGGGKGMNIVRNIADLEQAVKTVALEAERSFGSAEVYAEKFIEQPRHIEVQVLGDEHGNVIHLGERECSIQRRFQKVIEEAPSPTITPEQRKKLCDTAVAIAGKVEYSNAGTIEFIVDGSGDFYFLEMNTRIQVEHPVTEYITGLDIVELQLSVAEGERIFPQDEVEFHGHAIEARIYAEDPGDNFAPSTGQLLRYRSSTGEGVRLDNGVAEGDYVTSSFDPMIAKLITHGSDRKQAVEGMKAALGDTLLFGVTNNIEYLIRIMELPEFLEAKLSTDFLSKHESVLLEHSLSERERDIMLAATALVSKEFIDPRFSPPSPLDQIGAWTN